MYYQICANVTKQTEEGTLSIQVPTFYLNSNVQGIVSADHAEQIAREVINPSNDPSLSINLCVVSVFN